MKLANLLLAGIPGAASSSPSNPNASQLPHTSQFYKSSACTDEIVHGFEVVICNLWDKSVINWPPIYFETRNISVPYAANCYNEAFEDDFTALICDYGDIEVIHWPEKLLQSRSHISFQLFSNTMKKEYKTPEEIVDELLFKTSLDRFIARREKRDPLDLVWESDGCTHAPDNPMGFNFLPACQRHDFGYRNYRAQNRLTKATKKKINKQFKDDLHGICHKHLLRRPACKITATLFYEAVKHNHIDNDAMAQLD